MADFGCALFPVIFAASFTAVGVTGCHDSQSSSPAGGAADRDAKRPSEIRLNYATYDLSSLVLKRNGWIEQDLAHDGIAVRWVFSQGSNKSNELLASGSVDLASTAGSAALLARSNGVPLKVVYVFAGSEWTTLIVGADSPVKTLADLRGKKIAVTRGTDPFFFVLRSLHTVGLGQHDVELVHLQHAEGRLALQRGDVDAWAGLDPFMASAELREHARIIYRNIAFNTFGTLNAREDFLSKYPGQVQRVIAHYERARQWILAHPSETVELLATEGKIELEVATRQIRERAVLDHNVGVPGEALHAGLEAIIPILISEKLVGADANPVKALGELIDPAAAKAVIH